MKLEYSNTVKVTYAQARERVLEYLIAHASTRPAHMVAGAIWPNHRMHNQGAGGSASRILKRMAQEGLVEWTAESTAMGHRLGWGWIITSKGRHDLLKFRTETVR